MKMDQQTETTETREMNLAMARRIQQTLGQFGIPVTMGDIFRGPTMTRFELETAPGIRVEQIMSLAADLTAALKTECHIAGPIPGRSCLGVDVANASKERVLLSQLWESQEWKTTEGRLPVALGRDIYNRVVVADLADMPHLLIAGRVNSGKSTFVDALVASLLSRFSPGQVRFVMVDLNVIELQHYNGLPHLIGPVVTHLGQAPLALQWMVNEMANRYQLLAEAGAGNIASFNRAPEPGVRKTHAVPPFEKICATPEGFFVASDALQSSRQAEPGLAGELPYLVLILNEPAELMLSAPMEAELAISRLAQMGRDVGIHCILATRDASSETLTQKIRANFPARAALRVACKADSRLVLNAPGAEKLLGQGDMLFLAPDSHQAQRIQAPYISEQEVSEIVSAYCATTSEPHATTQQRP